MTGVGSSWSTASDLVVGGLGSGVLTIQNGGRISSATGSVGQSAGSSGVVTVTGAGSNWTLGPGGGLNVGSFGTGTLNVKLSAAELDKRRKGWKPRNGDFGSGYIWKYAQQVGDALHGAVTHPGGAAEKSCYADI